MGFSNSPALTVLGSVGVTGAVGVDNYLGNPLSVAGNVTVTQSSLPVIDQDSGGLSSSSVVGAAGTGNLYQILPAPPSGQCWRLWIADCDDIAVGQIPEMGFGAPAASFVPILHFPQSRPTIVLGGWLVDQALNGAPGTGNTIRFTVMYDQIQIPPV